MATSPYERLLAYADDELKSEATLKASIEGRAIALVTATVATVSLLLVVRQVGSEPVPSLSVLEIAATAGLFCTIAASVGAAMPRFVDATAVTQIGKLVTEESLTDAKMLGYALRGRVEDLSAATSLNESKAWWLRVAYGSYALGSILWLLALLLR
jgi:hypothetical protein